MSTSTTTAPVTRAGTKLTLPVAALALAIAVTVQPVSYTHLTLPTILLV